MDKSEVKRIRKKLGLTQKEMALTLGLSDGITVRRWESGSRIVGGTTATLLQLLDDAPNLVTVCAEINKQEYNNGRRTRRLEEV